MQPPAQELVAKDLHDNVWTFRHIYRGRFILLPFEISLIGHKALFPHNCHVCLLSYSSTTDTWHLVFS